VVSVTVALSKGAVLMEIFYQGTIEFYKELYKLFMGDEEC
jgi:hypothetical protein